MCLRKLEYSESYMTAEIKNEVAKPKSLYPLFPSTHISNPINPKNQPSIDKSTGKQENRKKKKKTHLPCILSSPIGFVTSVRGTSMALHAMPFFRKFTNVTNTGNNRQASASHHVHLFI